MMPPETPVPQVSDVETLLRLAEAARNGGQPAQAALRLRQCAGQLVAANRAAEALSCLDHALVCLDDAFGHYDRGTVLLQLGRTEPALADFDRALDLAPDWVSAWVNRGVARERLGRAEDALGDFSRAAELDPACAEAFANQVGPLRTLGRLDEALAASERAIALEPGAADHYCARGNVLAQLERFPEALIAYDAAIARRRNVAAYYNNRGQAQRALGNLAMALADYTQSCILDGRNAVVHDNRGVVLMDLNRPAEALNAFDRALTLQPELVSARANRGRALLSLDRPAEAVACFTETLARDPENDEHVCNRALGEMAQGHLGAAEADFARVLARHPDRPEFQWNVSLLRLATGNFAEGWKLYEARWQRPPLKTLAEHFPLPVWQGTPSLAGRKLLVLPEQGAGDMIQIYRFLPRLGAFGGEVSVVVPAPLLPLFAEQENPPALVRYGDALPAADLCCPIMSLPLILGIGLDDLPGAVTYLKADAARRAVWRARLGARSGAEPVLRVGLVWSGSTTHANDRNRSLPFTALAPLLRLPAEFHVLQPEIRAGDEVATENPALHLHAAELTGYAETAALIAELDLVITVDTSVAHLAGALGKPVWILLPFAADWRWMSERSDSPWYPSARLFRQPQIGNWGAVIDTVGTQLAAVLAKGAVC